MGAFLDEPVTTKKIQKYQHKKLRAFSVEMQGWRKHMEDAVLYFRFDKDTFLFAVFDGHGGAEVAKFCSLHIAAQLSQNKNFIQKKFQKAFKQVFQRLDELMDCKQGQQQLRQISINNGMQPFAQGKVADSVGCTANVVVLSENTLVVANTGDSRAALSRSGKILELSKDHKPQDPEEEKRITASGAKVDKGRINSHLNLSRCLGDLHYKRNQDLPPNKQTVICEPDVRIEQLCKDDQFLLMGCDGIWERYEQNGQELLQIIRKERYNGKSPQIVLTDLMDGFLAKDPKKEQLGCDNMSCILIEFNKLML